MAKQTLLPCEVKNEIQTGEITADKWGLITIEKLKVSEAGNRIKITAAHCSSLDRICRN